jgi:hypothetical protein
MLYTIDKGNVPGYTGGEDPIVHLVAYAEAVAEAGIAFAFTDGHSTVRFTDFFDDLQNLTEIDWKLMTDRYWGDTADDNDRLRRRQAEFLVYQFCPWGLIQRIGVKTDQLRDAVNGIIEAAQYHPIVEVHRDWYYR